MPDTTELVAAVTGGLLPRHTTVRSADVSLHCLVWGDDGAPTVLLVHGNGGHAHWWDVLVPFFVPGYRLVAPDLRGHGESDWPRQRRAVSASTPATLVSSSARPRTRFA